jgi:hypothetical protein
MDDLELVLPTGQAIALVKDRLLLGRDAACDVVVDDASVSRRHAVVEKRPEGWLILDQKSANGTFVDGQRVIQAFLRAGQELRLGSVILSLLTPGTPGGDPPVAKAGPPTSAPSPLECPAVPDPPQAAAVAQPAHPSMTEEAAAGILGAGPGARAEEILRRYHKQRDDLTARLKHAPTPALKRMYQKNLQDLRSACEVLLPGGTSL